MKKLEENVTYDADTMLAFIDILGFKELLKEKTLAQIVNIIDDIKQLDNSIKYSKMLTINTKLISDSFVVYAQLTEPKHITAFYVYVSTIIARVHRLGSVVTRGYISTGNHYNKDEIWISPAFVEAYIGETKKSIHPRVILGKSTLDYINKIYPRFLDSNFLKRDSDGYWFINYMTCISGAYTPKGETIIASMSTRKSENSPLKEHKKAIIFGLQNKKKYINKYFWLASYHNAYVNKKNNLDNKQDFLIDTKNY